MACRYVFTEEQIQELTNAANANKRKDLDILLRDDEHGPPSLICLPVKYANGGTTREG